MKKISTLVFVASLLVSACGTVTASSDIAAPAGTAAEVPEIVFDSVTTTSVAQPVAVVIDSSTSNKRGRVPGPPPHLSQPHGGPSNTLAPLAGGQVAPTTTIAAAPVVAVAAPAVTQPVVVTVPPVAADPPAAPAPTTTASPVTTTTPPTTTVPTPTTVAAGASLPTDPAAAARFAADINRLRSGLGLATLTRSAQLDSLALGWARTMASDGVLRHSTIIHSLVQGQWTSAAENVGYGPDEAVVFSALKASSGHRTNMINPVYTSVGTAVVVAGNTIWTVHLFAG